MSGKLRFDLREYAAVCKTGSRLSVGCNCLSVYIKLGRANTWPKKKFIRITEGLMGSPC